ncbi:DegQ family serine endoprotease [Quisquiliibacterium transsilvanicum]|uniref:Probable periplasmic serine endoprotease DegP-like n=1 Tax=Quisquiliibacterium transsilvanicum TaxID=1549638 RepID=A0A7W8HED0_9BURK|nr:DegQ family serine endoprotease [Quisquiliibacterium transsilvanicum]MBB5270292.1 serine protease Do [Quisquiliibacterium transsilvanicum]
MRKLLFILPLVVAVLTGGGLPAANAQGRDVSGFADLVEKASPTVVNIRTTARGPSGQAGMLPQLPEGLQDNEQLQEFLRRFFPPRQPGQGPRGEGQEIPRGVGSGFIISANGFVVTNHHVINGADEIYVTLADKREFKGKLIGSDLRTDIALVRIEGTGLPHATIGDSTRLRVGEWVVAIGSPFGLDNTVTAGIVSAKGRDTGDYLPFIQTDAAVNPGNSGGPLLNTRGEVVGVNSQIYSRTGGFMGISFSIPIDEAMRVVEQLKTNGRVVRGRIGVGIADVTREVAEPLGLPRAGGALVRSVESGGPAERAGLEVGDIIQRFDGKPIDKASDLPRMVGDTRPGSKVALQVWRKGSIRDLQLTVAELQPDQSPRARAQQESQPGAAARANALGLAVTDIPAERRAQLGIRNGVLVEAADGPAARAGLRQGDIVLSLDNQDVGSAAQFNELSGKLDRSRTHVLLVRRGDSAAFVPIKPSE